MHSGDQLPLAMLIDHQFRLEGRNVESRRQHLDPLVRQLGDLRRLMTGDEDAEVSAGSALFVAAEVEHRFYDIAEELAVLVFFAPAES